MGHGVGIPALGQHGDGHDATNIPPRRNALIQPFQGAVIVFAGDLFIVLADKFRPLFGNLAARPLRLAHGVEDEAQSPGFILRAALFMSSITFESIRTVSSCPGGF
jgi:hypothetical protein